jgi:hypothetical protein
MRSPALVSVRFPPPLVVRADTAADQSGLLQLVEDQSRRRAVEAEELRHRDLVDAGVVLEHEQDAVLAIGDAERAGLFEKERDRDLVGAPDQKAGAAIEFVKRTVHASTLRNSGGVV